MNHGRGLQANLAFENSYEGDLTLQPKVRQTLQSTDLATTQTATQPTALTRWEPERWPVSPAWQPVISRFLRSEPAQRLSRFVQDRLAQGATVYPPQPFRALELTPLERVKVVILGQDPYHGPGQAQGLAFSVAPGVALPPSLRNIFKELARDARGMGHCRGEGEGEGADKGTRNRTGASAGNSAGNTAFLGRTAGGALKLPGTANGSLEAWAQQGVLLLNTCFTVEQGQPASHAKQGWEALTDAIIQAVGASQHPVVFMLWGAHAQAKRGLLVNAPAQPIGGPVPGLPLPLNTAPRLVLTANHPSPLSALRPPDPFIGCGHFYAANVFLKGHGLAPVSW